IYDRYTLEAAFNLTENETLEQIADLVPDYSIVVIQLANNSWMNLPPVNTQGIIWITKTNGENCYAQFWDRVADTQYFNNRNLQSGLFMGWQQIALAAPPVSYVPELSPNFTRGTGDMFYYRNSFGEINVSADVIKTGANIASGDLIMTLPAGFRPTRLYELPANYFNTSNGVNYAGFVRFTADGQITAQYGQIAGTVVAQQMSFQCVFLAGN
ncbi:MAG: hypothetical protein FWF44_07445, partial [Defluviitaleaceae bacterium]|nr:hypothetical protein [Defluviitaleaceae bacterium]